MNFLPTRNTRKAKMLSKILEILLDGKEVIMSDCPFCDPKINDEKVHLFLKVVHNGKNYVGHMEMSTEEASPEEIIRKRGDFLIEAAIRTLRNRGIIFSSEPE